MAKTRRVTANLPDDLLREAMHVTGTGITETIVSGLRLLRRTRAHEMAMALRGKIELAPISTSRVTGVVADTSEWIEFFAGRPALARRTRLPREPSCCPRSWSRS